jgi:gamma-glutamylcyclotransferase (GGCT)/AIG2-like uncharacterized protein YtfP
MKYFSYGMNTNSRQMAQRCPEAVSLGYAQLLGHEFRFAVHADVIPNPNSVVHGVLWEITPACLESLDMLEGYPSYYLRDIVTVNNNGKEELAFTYYMVDNQFDYMPGEGYLGMLYEGYMEHNVPDNQIVEAIEFIKENNCALTNGRFLYE